MYPLPLTLANLTLPKEKTYFNLLRIIAILMWIAITATVVGLPYALLLGFFLWLVNGLLIAHLRSEGVQVADDQFPQLYQTYRSVVANFNLAVEPELYIVQSQSVLNAFATRHSGRNFVVIYSSILDAYGYDSPEIRFLIGHEIGHIHAKHLPKRLLLAPAMILPWLPPAYSRACEASSDRYGAFAAGDIDGAISAMMTLSAGKMPASKMTPAVFARQHFLQRGFSFPGTNSILSTQLFLSASPILSLSKAATIRRHHRAIRWLTFRTIYAAESYCNLRGGLYGGDGSANPNKGAAKRSETRALIEQRRAEAEEARDELAEPTATP